MLTAPTSRPPSHGVQAHRHVVIAGGGVAAIETALALRELLGEHAVLTLVSPSTEFVLPPLAVGAPFVATHVPRWPLDDIATELDAALIAAAVERVFPDEHRVQLSNGITLAYDLLVVALGARRLAPFPQVQTFLEDDPGSFGGLLSDLECGWSRSVAFVVPPMVSWTLPAYELALLTARDLDAMGIDGSRLTIVTPEEHPLALFGPEAGLVAHDLLREAGVAVECRARVTRVSGGSLWIAPGHRRLRAERVVALPSIEGHRLRGLPHDEHGFLRIDEHARVRGVADVFAAGDGTDFPVKQGGIATQQADAAAEWIAATAGATVSPRPFRPVLRGQLLTGDAPYYFVNQLTGGSGGGLSSPYPLWTPATKIAGRYLGPWAAGRTRELAGPTDARRPFYT
jgi:sulfide:quinone oxidoreductase